MKIIWENLEQEPRLIETNNTDFLVCEIYVPKKYNFNIINIYVNDILIETQKSASSKPNYDRYIISAYKTFNMNGYNNENNTLKIVIEGISIKDKTVFLSTPVTCALDFNNYNKQVVQNYSNIIGNDIADKYSKIVQLTKLCIDVCDMVQQSVSNKDGE